MPRAMVINKTKVVSAEGYIYILIILNRKYTQNTTETLYDKVKEDKIIFPKKRIKNVLPA